MGRSLLSEHENLLVGMVGGTAETALLMPVLTWKFCLQEGRPYPRFPKMYRGVGVQAVRERHTAGPTAQPSSWIYTL
jgi:hypothetical protein